jgi:hypothetical protein
MPLIVHRLAGPVAFATSAADIYEATNETPSTTTAVIKEIILCNTSGSAQTVTLYLKPKDVTVASSHIFINSLSLAANETVTFSTSLVLTNNGSAASDVNSDKIRGLASATSVNIILNGYVEY